MCASYVCLEFMPYFPFFYPPPRLPASQPNDIEKSSSEKTSIIMGKNLLFFSRFHSPAVVVC